MGYALSVLGKLGGLKSGALRRLRLVNKVSCAFCGGSGQDPKYGTAAGCPVCGGSGQVQTRPPVVICLVCAGTGHASGDLPCVACRGVGVASISARVEVCPRCQGSGQDGIFYCNYCKGQGLI
jgi:DnaJ-class molecular chaperone